MNKWWKLTFSDNDLDQDVVFDGLQKLQVEYRVSEQPWEGHNCPDRLLAINADQVQVFSLQLLLQKLYVAEGFEGEEAAWVETDNEGGPFELVDVIGLTKTELTEKFKEQFVEYIKDGLGVDASGWKFSVEFEYITAVVRFTKPDGWTIQFWEIFYDQKTGQVTQYGVSLD